MRAWRIIKSRHQDKAFDGEGARRYGGRLNRRGQRAVYASEHLSLAALETVVHTGVEERQLRFVKFEIDVPDALIRTFDVAGMPEGWDAQPPLPKVQHWGSETLIRHGAIRVPSVIVPEECNIVMAPDHPAFGSIRISESSSFHWDRRLLD